MSRITPVGLTEMPERIRELVERVPFYRGEPRNLFTTPARQERLFPSWFRFTMSLLTRGDLTPRAREIAIVRTAAHADSSYELAQHVELAEQAGLNRTELASLLDLSEAAGFVGEEADLIAFVDEMADSGDVSEETWARLVPHLGESQMVELTMIVAYYKALAMLLRVLRVPLEPGMTDPRYPRNPAGPSTPARRDRKEPPPC